MPLPTRTEFLATGLVPVQNATDACSICYSEMDSAVKLKPCDHVFCRECITTWLKQPATSTCPMDRKTLFTTKEEDDGPTAPDATRREQAIRALRASGLASASTVGTHFEDSAPFSAVERFDESIPLNRSQVMRSAARAFEIVAWNNIPRTTGTARFRASSLGANLIAMANMLKHMAFQQARPRPYANAANPWAQIGIAIWQILSPKQGIDLDALVVPGVVMADLRRRFATQMDSPVGMFFSDEAAANDLEMLIAMLVSEAKHDYLQEIGILRPRGAQAQAAPGTVSRSSGIFSRLAPRSVSPRGAARSDHPDTLNHGHADADAICAVM
ncbi:hypothetical protein MBLNU13_g06017t1 [Cladosporium sp. NU13]